MLYSGGVFDIACLLLRDSKICWYFCSHEIEEIILYYWELIDEGDTLHHGGHFASWGTLCIMGDTLHHGGHFVSWGTLCVMGDTLRHGGHFASWGTLCVMGDTLRHGGHFCITGDTASWRTLCIMGVTASWGTLCVMGDNLIEIEHLLLYWWLSVSRWLHSDTISCTCCFYWQPYMYVCLCTV